MSGGPCVSSCPCPDGTPVDFVPCRTPGGGPMSERSVAQKLLIREGQRVALMDPPQGGAAILGALPPGVRIEAAASAGVDVAILFARDRTALAAAWPGLSGALGDATVLWLSYPKRGHGVETDLTRDHGW